MKLFKKTIIKKDYNNIKDENLMEMISKGNESAFNELYDRYSKRMLYYFNRMMAMDNEKAQDMLHDLFIKIVEKPHLFNPDKKFSTWFYTVATNMCRNEYRKRSRGFTVSLNDDFNIADNRKLNAVEQIDLKTFAVELKTELNKLKDTHKSVFVLRYQEHLSLKEISEIMDCSIGTIKSRLFYTTQKLAKKLRSFDPEINGKAYDEYIL